MSNFKSGVAVVFLFAVWSFFSSLTDGIALTILKVWNYPITLLLVTFLVSTAVLFVAFHVFRLAEYQDARALVGVAPALPIAAAQSLGFLLTYMSYSRVSLSFAQTLKSTDPLVNLVFSVLFFGQSFPLGIYLAILPIVAGVALTSSSDASFDAAGFALALTSTACFVLRSLIAKNTLTPLTSTNCYYFLSWLGALVTLPAWLLLEAPPLFGYASPLVSPALFGSVAPAFWAAAPPLAATAASPLAVTPAVALLSPPFLFKLLAVAGGHLTYNLVSYSVLMRVPALTHSVCNVTRRIGVIASSILWFGNVPSATTVAGMALVFAGVGLYMHQRARADKRARADNRAAAATSTVAAAPALVSSGSNKSAPSWRSLVPRLDSPSSGVVALLRDRKILPTAAAAAAAAATAASAAGAATAAAPARAGDKKRD